MERSARMFGRVCAARARLRHMLTRDEAIPHTETTLLRRVETLVQRLLGVGQAPQRRSPVGQRTPAPPQALGRIGFLPHSSSYLALRKPRLAHVAERLLGRG